MVFCRFLGRGVAVCEPAAGGDAGGLPAEGDRRQVARVQADTRALPAAGTDFINRNFGRKFLVTNSSNIRGSLIF
jgi:hypothetical protein